MGRQSLPLAPDLTRLGGFRARHLALGRRLCREPGSARRKLQHDCASGRLEPAVLSALRLFLGEPPYRANSADVSFDPVFPGDPRNLAAVSGFRSRASAADRPRQCGCRAQKHSARPPGVAMFIVPCALIAAAFFRPSERVFAFALLALALAIFLGIDSPVLAPLHTYSQTEYAAFVRLNALSASALVALLGLMLSGLMKD